VTTIDANKVVITW